MAEEDDSIILSIYASSFFIGIRSSSPKMRAFEIQFFKEAGTEAVLGNWIGDLSLILNYSNLLIFPQGKVP